LGDAHRGRIGIGAGKLVPELRRRHRALPLIGDLHGATTGEGHAAARKAAPSGRRGGSIGLRISYVGSALRSSFGGGGGGGGGGRLHGLLLRHMLRLVLGMMLHRRLFGRGALRGRGSSGRGGRSGRLVGLGESGERRQGKGGAEADGGNLL